MTTQHSTPDQADLIVRLMRARESALITFERTDDPEVTRLATATAALAEIVHALVAAQHTTPVTGPQETPPPVVIGTVTDLVDHHRRAGAIAALREVERRHDIDPRHLSVRDLIRDVRRDVETAGWTP